MSPVNKMLIDIKGEIDSNIIVGDTLLISCTDLQTEKINMELAFNDT